jgi:hypothetical protein
MHLMKKHSALRREDGFILMQVVIASVIMLGLLLTGFNTVRSTIRLTNSVATTTDFKNFMLGLEHEFAVSETCITHFGNIAVGTPISTIDVPGLVGFPTTVMNADSVQIAFEEKYDSLGNPLPIPTGSRVSPGFTMREVRIRNVALLGWNFGAVAGLPGKPGSQQFARYTANLDILVDRRSEFLGTSEMRGTIPILFEVDNTSAIQNCSTRSIYSIPLGPPGSIAPIARKSGLECIDRGGTPVKEAGQEWFVCALPTSSWQLCDGISATTLPGWNCLHPAIAGDGVTYAY